MTVSSVNVIRITMILAVAGLCFSSSFSAIQYLPTVQAQTQAATSPQPSIEELNVQMIERTDGSDFLFE